MCVSPRDARVLKIFEVDGTNLKIGAVSHHKKKAGLNRCKRVLGIQRLGDPRPYIASVLGPPWIPKTLAI